MRQTALLHRVGITLLALSVCLPIAALLFPAVGLPSAASSLWVGLFVAGTPELVCLAAIALLGQDGFRRLGCRATSASRLRYYGGLAYCLLNTLPITLYAYAPHVMPEAPTKYFILAATDLGFVLSIFLMGGEFWEKFRRLFVWEGSNRDVVNLLPPS